MTFNGWVAVPRSILNNTHTGFLTNNEQLVLLTLMFLADAKTGRGYINAAALCSTYLPELKYDSAKRILQSLQDKGIIYRRITHASKKLYPFWLHGFQISDGPNKMLWTNLEQVFITDDLGSIQYEKAVPDCYPDHHPDHPPDHAPNNNKDRDNEIDNEKDKPLGIQGRELDVRDKVTENVSALVTNSVSECEKGCESDVRDNVSENVILPPQLPPGFEYRHDARDGAGIYSKEGTKVHASILPMLCGGQI